MAPERFLSAGDVLFHETTVQLTESMDIFSLGYCFYDSYSCRCTIAELYLEGTPLFTLSQLLRYKKGEFDPDEVLHEIHDVNIQDLVRHMIQIDPTLRSRATDYLREWKDLLFPLYFETTLYPYLSGVAKNLLYSDKNMTTQGTDALVESLFMDYSELAYSCELKAKTMELLDKSLLIHWHSSELEFPLTIGFPHSVIEFQSFSGAYSHGK